MDREDELGVYINYPGAVLLNKFDACKRVLNRFGVLKQVHRKFIALTLSVYPGGCGTGPGAAIHI